MPKVKKCPNCGATYEVNKMCCDNCKESLWNVKPIEIMSTSDGDKKLIDEKEQFKENDNKVATLRLPPQPRLDCVNQPDFVFEIKDGAIIGRDGDIDISSLYNSDYISGKHAAFHFNNGNWYIEDLKSMNGTLVNQVRLQENQKQIIYEGDKITLANVTFIFRIRP